LDPPLKLDAGLRPEGKNGPLVRSLESYAAYYANWSEIWEAQALLRATYAAGDWELAQRWLDLVNPIRYPADGITEGSIREIRRIKLRVETERMPKGADANTNAKLGRGSLSDVEWTAQLLQLKHAGRIRELRTTSTVEALEAVAEAGELAREDADTLTGAWRLASRVRNATMLVRGKAGDQIPTSGRELVAVASILGHEVGSDPGEFLDEYRKVMRHSRSVVDRVFYGMAG
jgi:glutamate-ammonia-ligase adenylyltransferase